MKKILLAISFLVVALNAVYAEYPTGSGENIEGSALGYSYDSANDSGVWHPIAVDSSGRVEVNIGSALDIGSMSIDLAPVVEGIDLSTNAIGSTTSEVRSIGTKIDIKLSDVQDAVSSGSSLIVDAIGNIPATDLATVTSGLDSINTKLASQAADVNGVRWTLYRHVNNIKAEEDTATDTVMLRLRNIEGKILPTDLAVTNGLIGSNTESIVSAINNKVIPDPDFTTTNNLIGSNTEKLSATTTYTVPNYGDDTQNTSAVKSIAEMIAEQLGSTINASYFEGDSEGNLFESHSVPTVCRLVNDIGQIINEVIYDNFDWYLCYPTYNGDGDFLGSEPTLVTARRELLEDGSDISTPVGIASTLMSAEPIEMTADYSRTMTVADGLFSDQDGNPTHVLGRILRAVENGGSGAVGSVSVDLQKIERGVGVILNEGSDGDKGEPPEMEINLVDCFYDKGADVIFSGSNSLNQGITMYDMTKAGLIGQDEYGNAVPLLKEMLGVSYSVDSGMPKMADVVYSINSKIPQNAIASISQEAFSSRINLDNISLKLETLNTRVATITNELITLPSKGMGITAGITIGTSAVEFGGTAYPSKALEGWHRQFIEIISDEGDDGEFMIAFDSNGDTRKVKGRILLNIDKSQHVWISADSSTTVTVTEGWR